MLKNREITPQQSETLLEFASDVRAGQFGMPVNIVDPANKIANHRYHLIEVADVPFIKYPDNRHISEENPADWGRVSRVFRPSLEVAMGLREPGWLGDVWSSSSDAEFHHLTERSRLVERMRSEGMEVEEIADDQHYDSHYGRKAGKFLTGITIEGLTVVDSDKEEIPEAFEIIYDFFRKPSSGKELTLGSLVNPMYRRGFRFPLYRKIPERHNSTSFYFGGKFFYFTGRGRVIRSEADLVIADLNEIKNDYENWLPGIPDHHTN